MIFGSRTWEHSSFLYLLPAKWNALNEDFSLQLKKKRCTQTSLCVFNENGRVQPPRLRGKKKKKKNFFFKSFSFAQLKQENTIFKLNDIGEVFALWFSFIKITIKRDFWEKMDFLILFYLQLLWVWVFFWTRDLLNHWPLSLKVAIQSVCAVH